MAALQPKHHFGVRDLVLCAVLAAVTLAIYWNVTSYDFVHYDDDIYLLKNPHAFGGLTVENVAWAFVGKYEANWMPVTWISFFVDREMHPDKYGPQQPTIYHRTNLILHVLNTLVLFLALSSLTGSRWPSAVVAALFGVHPLHVESVAWIAERKDVMSTFFAFLTIWAYAGYARAQMVGNSELPVRNEKIKSRKRGSQRAPVTKAIGHSGGKAWRYGLVVALYVLGLMSKSMLVTLPLLLLLLDFWPLQRMAQSSRARVENSSTEEPGRSRLLPLVVEKVPLFGLALVTGVIAIFAQRWGHSLGSFEHYPAGIRLANAALSYIEYIGKSFWPVRLACFYPHPLDTIPTWQVVTCGGLLAAATAGAIAMRRRMPYVTVGWLWYVTTLLPVIGIIQVGGQAMADRYTYITLIGFWIAVVWTAHELVGRTRVGAILLSAVAAAAVVCLAVQARSQTRYWSDGLTLFKHAAEVTAKNTVVEYNLGCAYNLNAQEILRQEPSISEHDRKAAWADLDRAEKHLRESVRLDPKNAEAQGNLGGVLYTKGRFGDAKQRRRFFDEAYEHVAAALRLMPDDPQAHRNLASILLAQGKLDAGIKQLKQYLKARPQDEEAIRVVEEAEALKAARQSGP